MGERSYHGEEGIEGLLKHLVDAVEELTGAVHHLAHKAECESVRVRLEGTGSRRDPLFVMVVRGPTTTKAILKIGGSSMPGQITVDTTDETAMVQFLDDKGDVTSAPEGTQVTFASSDESVATIVADPNNPLQGDVVPVAPGSAQLSASFNGTALEADGSTPIADPDPVTVTVDPGAAVGARVALAE